MQTKSWTQALDWCWDSLGCPTSPCAADTQLQARAGVGASCAHPWLPRRQSLSRTGWSSGLSVRLGQEQGTWSRAQVEGGVFVPCPSQAWAASVLWLAGPWAWLELEA